MLDRKKTAAFADSYVTHTDSTQNIYWKNVFLTYVIVLFCQKENLGIHTRKKKKNPLPF